MADPNQTGIDPDLEEWLSEARSFEREAGGPEISSILPELENRLQDADRSVGFWIRSRPTWIRRLIAGVAVLLVILVGGLLTLRPDVGDLPPLYTALGLGSLGVLLAFATFLALRPLHRPPLARGVTHGLAAATLAATFALAIVAPGTAVVGTTLTREMVSPCLFYGLFLGLPVYVVLRLLDRGSALTALIAACSAGLAGNLVLQLHCPLGGLEHLMGAHFSVAVVFVVGLYAAHVLLARLRG